MKDPWEHKYQYLINNWEVIEEKHFANANIVTEYYKWKKNKKIMILLDNMIAEIKIIQKVIELLFL